MRTLSLFFVLSVAALAQTLSLTGPAGRLAPGATVTLTLNLAGSTGKNVAALQSSVTITPAQPILTVAAGAAATAASKAPDCNLAPAAGAPVCLFIGDNANAWQDGAVATISFTMPATPVSVTLSGAVAADVNGGGVAITAAGPFALNPITCDVNGDGKTDSTDEQIQNDSAAGKLTTGIDLNGDGVVNAIDAQRVVNAKNGAACRIGQ